MHVLLHIYFNVLILIVFYVIMTIGQKNKHRSSNVFAFVVGHTARQYC